MRNLKQALLAALLMPVFISCATYRQRIDDYYRNLQSGNYLAATKQLDKNRILKHTRNRVLYFLEKGYTLHLMKQYDSSNSYLNAADKLMEAGNNGAADMAVSIGLSPMLARYKPEDYERFMVHYYKALNYLYLSNIEDALVEARRISLSGRSVADQHSVITKKYTNDAFALILQGVIYEKDADINNAFISYRNAADIFLKHESKDYYGVTMPEQLKKDVLRTAYLMGFRSDLEFYERKFNMKFNPSSVTNTKELVLFTEVGMAPAKREMNTMFTLFKDGEGFFFSDYTNRYRIPVDYSIGIKKEDISLDKMKTFRIALPSYSTFRSSTTSVQATILKDSSSFIFEKVEDLNVLATSLLQERMLKEVGTALSRMLLRKLAEKEASKKDKALGEVLEALSFAAEQADTRNWQSLPSNIYYARIPLTGNTDSLSIRLDGHNSRTVQLAVSSTQQLQVYNVRDMN